MQSWAELTSTDSQPQLDLSGSVMLVALCVDVNSLENTRLNDMCLNSPLHTAWSQNEFYPDALRERGTMTI